MVRYLLLQDDRRFVAIHESLCRPHLLLLDRLESAL